MEANFYGFPITLLMSFVVSIAIFFYNVHSENKLLNLNLTENYLSKTVLSQLSWTSRVYFIYTT